MWTWDEGKPGSGAWALTVQVGGHHLGLEHQKQEAERSSSPSLKHVQHTPASRPRAYAIPSAWAARPPDVHLACSLSHFRCLLRCLPL